MVLLYLHSQTKGELAQLVERLHGMQEVSGSTPLFSTNFKLTSVGFFNGYNQRNCFGLSVRAGFQVTKLSTQH